MPLLILKNYDLCFVLSAQSHLVQNGNRREFGLAAEIWYHAGENVRWKVWSPTGSVLSRSTGIAWADLRARCCPCVGAGAS